MASDRAGQVDVAEEGSVGSRQEGDGFERLAAASLLFGFARHAKAMLLPVIGVMFFASNRSGGMGWEYWLALLFVPMVVLELYQYYTVKYRVTRDELVIKKGLLFRRERHIPLARIHNIDLVQNPLHRWLRVAEAKVETAGGGGDEPEAVFSVLSMEAIDRLRRKVLLEKTPVVAGAASEGAPVEEITQASAGTVLLRIPTAELVKLGLISNRGMALIMVAVGVAWEFGFLQQLPSKSFFQQQASHWNTLGSLLLLGAGLVASMAALRVLSVVWMVLYFHGYELRRDDGDLRITCGLFTRVTSTIPVRRIQLVSVRQTLLQRWLGTVTVRVETAGSSGGGGSEKGEDRGTLSRRWFIPTLPIAGLPRILDELRPGLDADFTSATWSPASAAARGRMLRLALMVSLLATLVATAVLRPWGVALGLVFVPLAIWNARREGAFMAHAATGLAVMFRSGAWTRQTTATFYDKIQVVTVNESPMDRRHRMASIAVDTAGAGPAQHVVRVPYLPREVATAMASEVYERTERTRFRW